MNPLVLAMAVMFMPPGPVQPLQQPQALFVEPVVPLATSNGFVAVMADPPIDGVIPDKLDPQPAADLPADHSVMGAVAHSYRSVLPKPVRGGLRHFFHNLHEPINALNCLIQLRPRRAMASLARFAVNTTAGIAGIVDVAEKHPINLPYRRNGFANSLAYYGVKPGPFMVLPLIGPTTLRDLLGSGVDSVTMPMAIGPIGGTGYMASSATVKAVDRRSEADETGRTALYAQVGRRAAYLAARDAEVEALHDRPHAVADASVFRP